MTYTSWRISYQDSEQAARAAYAAWQESIAQLEAALTAPQPRTGEPQGECPGMPNYGWNKTTYSHCRDCGCSPTRPIDDEQRDSCGQCGWCRECVESQATLVSTRRRGLTEEQQRHVDWMRAWKRLGHSTKSHDLTLAIIDALTAESVDVQGGDRLFNLNEKVEIKLTDRGRTILQRMEQHYGVSLDFKQQADADGWSRWQLWDIIATFGTHVYHGCNPPFETTIRLAPRPRAERREEHDHGK